MSEHNHTGLDEAASVASNTMQAVRTGKAHFRRGKGRCGRRALWICHRSSIVRTKAYRENSGGRAGVTGAAATFYFAPAWDYLWKPDG